MDAETTLVSYAEKLSYPNYMDQPQHIKNLIARAFRLHQQEIAKARIDELDASLQRQWSKGLDGTNWKQYHLDRLAELKQELESYDR